MTGQDAPASERDASTGSLEAPASERDASTGSQDAPASGTDASTGEPEPHAGGTGRPAEGVDRRVAVGLLAGLGLTSASLSSGFIWAYQDRAPLVVAAAAGAWAGYLAAHYAVTGRFVDGGGRDAGASGTNGATPAPEDCESGDGPPLGGAARHAGIGLGVALLVAGMYVGAGTIRSGEHLLTNVGGALFLGGYVVAHYAATGEPL